MDTVDGCFGLVALHRAVVEVLSSSSTSRIGNPSTTLFTGQRRRNVCEASSLVLIEKVLKRTFHIFLLCVSSARSAEFATAM